MEAGSSQLSFPVLGVPVYPPGSLFGGADAQQMNVMFRENVHWQAEGEPDHLDSIPALQPGHRGAG